MSFFEDSYKNEINKLSQKIQTNIEARKNVEDDVAVSLIEQMEAHYKKQLQLPVDQRDYFREYDEEGKEIAAIILYNTEIEADRLATGINVPKITDSKSLYYWAPIPLFTQPDAQFFERVTVFANPDDFSDKDGRINLDGIMFPTKWMVIARGWMKTEYKPQTISEEYKENYSKKGYAIGLDKFLEYCGVESLEELDVSDYSRKFTFNQNQVLRVIKL